MSARRCALLGTSHQDFAPEMIDKSLQPKIKITTTPFDFSFKAQLSCSASNQKFLRQEQAAEKLRCCFFQSQAVVC